MNHASSEVPAAHAVANEAVTRLGVPAAGASGLILSVVAIVTGRPVLLGIGLLALAIMILVAWQTRRQRPLPAAILTLASTSFAILAPFAEGGLEVSIIPVLVILAFLGIFTTARRTAIRLALWCAALIAWSIFWIYPDVSVVELIVVAAVLGGTAVSAFVVFIWADNARIQQEQSFWFLFEGSPIATWEQDYTRVVEWLDQVRLDGVDDLRGFYKHIRINSGTESGWSGSDASTQAPSR